MATPDKTEDEDQPAADPEVSAAQRYLALNGPGTAAPPLATSPVDAAKQGRNVAVPPAPDMSTGGELSHLGQLAGKAALIASNPLGAGLALTYKYGPALGAGALHAGAGVAGALGDAQTADLLNKGADKINPPPAPTAPDEDAKPPAAKTFKLTPPVKPAGGNGSDKFTPPPAPQMDMADPATIAANQQAALDANQQAADVAAKTATAQQPLKEQLATEMGTDAAKMAQRMNEDRDQLQEHINNVTKFDAQQAILADDMGPNHYWNNLSTGEKVLTGVGIFLSTVASAASKGRLPNIGWDWFQQNIEQDNQAMLKRYQNLGTQSEHQRSLASLALETFHDEPVALAAMNKAKADAVAYQLEATAGRYSDERVKAVAAQEAAKIRTAYSDKLIDAYKQRNEARLQGSEMQRNRAENALAPLKAQRMQQEIEANQNSGTLTDANGAPLPGLRTPQEAEAFRKESAGYRGAVTALGSLHALARAQGPFSFTNADEFKARVLAALPDGPTKELIAKTAPSHLGPADAEQWLEGVQKTYAEKDAALTQVHR